DRRVVHLGDDADVAVLEALDDVDLPERPAPVELPAGDVAGQLGQLVIATGGRRGDAPQVVVEVEVGILDPHRVVQIEGNRRQTPGELRDQVQAPLDQVAHLVEGVSAF